MAMPLHLAILSHARFPLPLLGLVHLANRTEMLDTVAPDTALDFACTLDGISASAKGPSFTLHTEARVQGRVVWREQSTYLYPLRSSQPRRAPSQHAEFTGAPIAQWEVATDAGRRFAVPVRDFNPIHLSDWSARLLGQRSAIAHGLYSAARCLDVLRQQQPLPTPFVLDVQFKRPLPLPAQVVLLAQQEEKGPHAPPLRGSLPPEGAAFSSWGGPAMKKGQRFALQILGTDGTDTGQTHLVGTLKPLRRAR
jgi:acyl dehydratase